MKKCSFAVAIASSLFALQLIADVTGPWMELEIPAQGYWNRPRTTFKLSKPIGCFAHGYVYTNAQGRVFQFNLQSDRSKKPTREDAVKLIRDAEDDAGRRFNLTPFTPHKDSNPERYFFSEEASLKNYPHWSIRFYGETNKNGDMVLKMSIWNCTKQLLLH